MPLSADDLSALEIRSDGIVGVTIGLATTFYGPSLGTAIGRQTLAQWADKWLSRWSEQLHWGRHPRSGRWGKIGRQPTLASWLSELDPQMGFEFDFHGGERSEDASSLRLQGYAEPAWQGGWGYLRVCEPIAEDEPSELLFRDRIFELATQLRPAHGYGGYSICESPEVDVEQYFQDRVWALAQRHIGLEVDRPITHIAHLRECIKGVGWLTILGEAILGDRYHDVLTGLVASPDLEVTPYPGGQLIQAGSTPSLGGPLGEDIGGPLSVLARFLAPHRVRHHPAFHFAGTQRMHEEETLRWLARFDRQG